MLIFVIALGLVCLIMLVVGLRRKPPATDRLEATMREAGFMVPGSELDTSLQSTALYRGTTHGLARLHGWLASATPPRLLAAAQATMERAGYTGPHAPAVYIMVKAMLVVAAVVAVAGVLILFHGPLLYKLMLLLAVLIVTVIGPAALLSGKIQRRQDDIRIALPDVIDLLAVSAEAGMGLDAALTVVIRRKPGPLSDEIDRMLTEVRLGEDRTKVWTRMVERVGVPELKAFVGALQDAQEMGVSVSDTLRAQSDALRVKRSLTVRRLAAVLPIKMLLPLIFFIMPALFVVLLAPGLIAAFRAFDKLPTQ
jgi:tight adherence protein C